MTKISDLIRLRLGEIESRENVRLVYACESGSRAWGFPSADSDYDIRFIYIHPVEWYLSIGDRRDVIEPPSDGLLDINGWDIRKALKLFRKSNPPLYEWLYSPIVYQERFDAVSKLRELAKIYYSPAACIYHYLHMAQGNFRQYLRGEQVWLKKYFYVLRPLLAINWIERGYGVAPTSFGVLVDRLVTDQPLRSEITRLIEFKQKGIELDHGPRISVISEFIESEINRLESIRVNNVGTTAPVEELDRVFQDTLAAAWGKQLDTGFGLP
jgi:predicted nucleotidyltransferase